MPLHHCYLYSTNILIFRWQVLCGWMRARYQSIIVPHNIFSMADPFLGPRWHCRSKCTSLCGRRRCLLYERPSVGCELQGMSPVPSAVLTNISSKSRMATKFESSLTPSPHVVSSDPILSSNGFTHDKLTIIR